MLEEISRRCDAGECPIVVRATIDEYNKWIERESGGTMRTSYDVTKGLMIVREGCKRCHGVTRFRLAMLLRELYRTQRYITALGRIATAEQGVSPDCYIMTGGGAIPVAAEVGVSQSRTALEERAGLLLRLVPSLRHVVLLALHDEQAPENGRMYCWVVSRGGAPNAPPVEFGRVLADGAPNPLLWDPPVTTAPAPTMTLPPIVAGLGAPAVPATTLNLWAILEELRLGREDGDPIWEHPPGP